MPVNESEAALLPLLGVPQVDQVTQLQDVPSDDISTMQTSRLSLWAKVSWFCGEGGLRVEEGGEAVVGYKQNKQINKLKELLMPPHSILRGLVFFWIANHENYEVSCR